MKATVETIREIVKVLTADEQQLLKDTIKYGYWGDASAEFVDEKLGDIILADAEIYITNDASKGGYFNGLQVSRMFRSIYKKLCSAHGNQAGVHLSHCSDWWGNGTGDVLMLRADEDAAWKEWAKELAECEKRLGDVLAGSTVYSNDTGGTYQVVNQRPNRTTRVLCLDGPYKDSFCDLDTDSLVVVKKLGNGSTREALVARIKQISKEKRDLFGFSVRFTENDEGVEMSVSKKGFYGVANIYTRDQLREIANAINAYLAK